MNTVIVVGNPKPISKTRKAAENMVKAIGVNNSTTTIYDLSEIGCDLMYWKSDSVAAAVKNTSEADLLIVASPTFKGSFTGLTKLFLDALPYKGLRGVVAIPIMLGANKAHAMSVELQLRPVLVELGASCPTSGLYIIEEEYNMNHIYSQFVTEWESILRSLCIKI